MKIKKITLLFLACAATTVLATACTNCNVGEQSLTQPKANVVNFRTEQCELIVGDEFLLDVRYEMDETQSFVFSSSDESVVKVDENGTLHAIANGTATVTVKYGNATDECAVTVSTGNFLPVLQYDNLPNTTVRLTTNDQLTFDPKVAFNGKTYRDVEVSYALSDESVGKVENGTFTPSKTGKVEIYATADWRGITGETLVKTISLEVIKDVQLFVNDGADSSFLLYTLDDAQVPVTALATENGEKIEDVSLELVSGEKYVEFTNGKISSKGIAGSAELKMYCTDSEGAYWEKIVPVTVTQTVKQYEGEQIVNFSAMDGEVVGSKTIGQSIGGRIVRAQDENGNELTVKDGCILGVEMGGDGESAVTLTAFTARVGYTMTVKGYSGIFDEAEDLKFFGVHNEDYASHPLYDAEVDKYDRGYTFLMAKQEGYYVLADNIDATGYVQPNGGKDLSSALQTVAKDYIDPMGGVGLKGTFDGRGYTIRGLTVGTNGLFGIISGGTVKNVAFTDLKFTEKGTSGLMAQYTMDATFQNVYIQAEKINSGGLISSMMEGVFMSGCLFELPQETCSANNYGSITYSGGRLVTNHASLSLNGFNGVYVISPLVLARYKSTKTEYTIDGGNRDGSTYLFEGVTRYDTAEEMSAAYTGGKEYEQFSNVYWDKSGSIPTFKTKDFTGEKEVEWDEVVDDFDPDWITE